MGRDGWREIAEAQAIRVETFETFEAFVGKGSVRATQSRIRACRRGEKGYLCSYNAFLFKSIVESEARAS